jgi:excinuclease ABC subunit B
VPYLLRATPKISILTGVGYEFRIPYNGEAGEDGGKQISLRDLPKPEANHLLIELEKQMKQAAKDLEFEKAAMLRDQVFELRQHLNDIDDKMPDWEKVRRMGDAAAKDDLAIEEENASKAD